MFVTTQLLSLVPLVAMVVVAATIDLRERRIPNWLTVAIAVGGLTNSIVWAWPVGFGGSILGFWLGFTLLFIPFAIGAMGGGDVKLLAAIGAWVGWVATLQIFVIAALSALVIVLVQCAVTGRLALLFRNSSVLVANFASYSQVGHEHLVTTGQSMKSVDKPLPYALPILMGLITVVFMNFR